MVDQREAFTVTTGLTDTVYLVRPTGIQTINPWFSMQKPCILPWVKGTGWIHYKWVQSEVKNISFFTQHVFQ